MIECTEAKCKRWLLTDEGNQIADNGSHEAAVFYSIPSEGIALDELLVREVICYCYAFVINQLIFSGVTLGYVSS